MNYLVSVDTFFPDRPSGSARVAWDIAQAVRDKGHHVTVFCRKQKPDAAEVSEEQGVRVIRFEYPRTAILDPFKLSKQINAGEIVAQKYLNDTNWDVVHSHLPLNAKITYDVIGRGPRYLHTVHSPLIDEQIANWQSQGLPGRVKQLLGKYPLRTLEGGILEKVDQIHTLSQYTKRCLNAAYSVGGKITVIPHWCRKDFFRENDKATARQKLNWAQSDKIIFTVRRLAPRMGLDIAIRALAPLLKEYPDLSFTIAGAGVLEVPLKQLAAELGVSEKISFLGRVSDEDLRCGYEAADLFLLPTRSLECFGLPVLESLAFGLPLITTDAAAIPELMQPILPDCIVPAGNVQALIAKVSDWLSGKLQMPSSQVLVEHVKVRYSYEVIAPQILDFITK